MTTDLTARLDADTAHAQQIQARAEAVIHIAASVEWFDKFTAERYDDAIGTSAKDVPWLLARLGERDAALRAVLRLCDAAADPLRGSGVLSVTQTRAAVVSALSGGAE